MHNVRLSRTACVWEEFSWFVWARRFLISTMDPHKFHTEITSFCSMTQRQLNGKSRANRFSPHSTSPPKGLFSHCSLPSAYIIQGFQMFILVFLSSCIMLGSKKVILCVLDWGFAKTIDLYCYWNQLAIHKKSLILRSMYLCLYDQSQYLFKGLVEKKYLNFRENFV